jgi:hypothetical protein
MKSNIIEKKNFMMKIFYKFDNLHDSYNSMCDILPTFPFNGKM